MAAALRLLDTGTWDLDPVLADGPALAALASALAGCAPAGVDLVASVETGPRRWSCALGSAVARELGAGFVALDGLAVEGVRYVSAPYARDDGSSAALAARRDALHGKRVLLLSAWVRSAAPVSAAASLVLGAGGAVAGLSCVRFVLEARQPFSFPFSAVWEPRPDDPPLPLDCAPAPAAKGKRARSGSPADDPRRLRQRSDTPHFSLPPAAADEDMDDVVAETPPAGRGPLARAASMPPAPGPATARAPLRRSTSLVPAHHTLPPALPLPHVRTPVELGVVGSFADAPLAQDLQAFAADVVRRSGAGLMPTAYIPCPPPTVDARVRRGDVAVAYYEANAPGEDRHGWLVSRSGGFRAYLVLDGHGGPLASEWARQRLLREVEARVDAGAAPDAVARALHEAFVAVDADLLRLLRELRAAGVSGRGYNNAGSCAVALVVKDGVAHVAHVGDCRAVLGTADGGAVRLTADHNCRNAEERRLVIERSGTPAAFRPGLVSRGPERVAGSLCVTRAIGDAYLKEAEFSSPPFDDHLPYITAEPAVQSFAVTPDAAFIVLGSDGLWDVVSDEQAVAAVAAFAGRRRPRGAADGVSAAESLVRLVMHTHKAKRPHLAGLPKGAKRRATHDDVTVMVVALAPQLSLHAADAPAPDTAGMEYHAMVCESRV